jgi:CRP-like cAMP-binding protein
MPETVSRNRLLASLRSDDRRRLAPHLERAHLERGTALFDAGQEIGHIWFPEGAVVSITIVMAEGGSSEAATVGPEGAVGLVSALGGGRAAARAVVQVPGDALRLPPGALRPAFEASPPLRQACLCYADALLAQVLQGTACAALHPVEARLCRWLLQLQDRARGAAELPLTHDFLAEMLGVHRTSVTTAALTLQRAGLITYRRGRVTVLDRARLEEASCECYATIRAHYERLLPPGGGLP